jgi:hypothetical protein
VYWPSQFRGACILPGQYTSPLGQLGISRASLLFRRCRGSVVWRLTGLFEVLACRWFEPEWGALHIRETSWTSPELFQPAPLEPPKTPPVYPRNTS